MAQENCYKIVRTEIDQVRAGYPLLKKKPDDYTFSALCIQCVMRHDQNFKLTDDVITNAIVDGPNDGGVDFILPDSSEGEATSLILGQCKYYENITKDDVEDAVSKLIAFYKAMKAEQYEKVRPEVARRFRECCEDVGDESKIVFCIYTSAPKKKIDLSGCQSRLKEATPRGADYELKIVFGDDLVEEIRAVTAKRESVPFAKIDIDDSNNYLQYGDDAIIVNVSARCIKGLYCDFGVALLAQNLRYHVKGASIDRDISDSIKNDRGSFWFKNNGLTIICDSFEVDGKEVKLHGFSIINGGQTTYQIYKSSNIDSDHDLFVVCKIICAKGTNEDEKRKFTLSIAQASNSQKAIKPIDLKANAAEQQLFRKEMFSLGVFYSLKRGEIIPREYSEGYRRADLAQVGKVDLAGIFQMPCSSRNKPSLIYTAAIYNLLFMDADSLPRIAKLSAQLLYIDWFFRNSFIKSFEKENEGMSEADTILPFARNSRTICVAYVALASMYAQQIIEENEMKEIWNLPEKKDFFAQKTSFFSIFPDEMFSSKKDECDVILKRLFNKLIDRGSVCFAKEKDKSPSLVASDYLKNDSSYFAILKEEWRDLRKEILDAFSSVWPGQTSN